MGWSDCLLCIDVKAENEEKILHTARTMIASYGDSVSVREIAIKSGLSHPALRKRWKTRGDLFAAVHESINADLKEALGKEPVNETLPVFLIKALFALKTVQDAAGYYSYRFMPTFPEVAENNPLLERLVSACERYLKDNPNLQDKYGPLFSEADVLAAAIFSLLIAFSPARLTRVCQAVDMSAGVEEQLPIMFLNSLTAFLSAK